jgi:hypothetical protein
MSAFEMGTQIITSLGGGAVIAGAIFHFSGKMWADKITRDSIAAHSLELEQLRISNKRELDVLNAIIQEHSSDKGVYYQISSETYQSLFKKRIIAYDRILNIIDKYTTESFENCITDETEKWRSAYYNAYIGIRKVMIENSIVISNDLSKKFDLLRASSAKFIKDAAYIEVFIQPDPSDEEEAVEKIYMQFAHETSSLMNGFIDQVNSDVSKMRDWLDFGRIS